MNLSVELWEIAHESHFKPIFIFLALLGHNCVKRKLLMCAKRTYIQWPNPFLNDRFNHVSVWNSCLNSPRHPNT